MTPQEIDDHLAELHEQQLAKFIDLRDRWQATNKTPQQHGGVVFDDRLAGPGGVEMALFREYHHSDDDIRATKRYLRNQRDVVCFVIIKVPQRVV